MAIVTLVFPTPIVLRLIPPTPAVIIPMSSASSWSKPPLPLSLPGRVPSRELAASPTLLALRRAPLDVPRAGEGESLCAGDGDNDDVDEDEEDDEEEVEREGDGGEGRGVLKEGG